MYIATITFFRENERTGQTIVSGDNLDKLHQKIDAVKIFLKEQGCLFLYHVIEEIKNVRSSDSILNDLSTPKQLH